VDYVPFEEKVDVGDWLYTSGDDRVFPRGFPVGIVKAVHAGQPFKEILVEPSGMHRGLEDVLILLEGVHQTIPTEQLAFQPVYIAPAPPNAAPGPAEPAAQGGTDADKLRAHYKAVGDAQNHKFGEGLPGSKPPDFNLAVKPGQGPAPSQGPGAGGQAPATAATKAPTPVTASPAPGPRPEGTRPAPVSAPGPKPPAPASNNPDPGQPPIPPGVPISERPHNE
jgi:rod shape-determining protein MreC